MNYENEIYKTIQIIFLKMLRGLELDFTLTGKILDIDIEKMSYLTSINDYEQWLKARSGVVLEIGDIVYIRCVKGNLNEKFIDCKKP